MAKPPFAGETPSGETHKDLPEGEQRPGNVLVQCPHCSRFLWVSQNQIGKKIRCRYCYEWFTVPPPS